MSSANSEHAKRKTVSAMDVVHALKRHVLSMGTELPPENVESQTHLEH